MDNSNNPTYAQIISYVMPFFLARGGDTFASTERILFYLNCSIQDIFNRDSPTFQHKSEIISTFIVDWSYNRFVATYPILKINEWFWSTSAYIPWEDFERSYQLNPELYLLKCESDIKFQWKQILTHKDIQAIEVSYIRDYEWITETTKLNEEVPLPRRYIPPLIKLIYDWAAPINLTVSEWATTDFFSHAANRMDSLAIQDGLTDIYWLRK